MCREGYSGEACENNIDDCATEPCLNGGTCRDEVGGFKCACQQGWAGDRCQKDIGTCTNLPCQNDAVCIDLFQDYFCVYVQFPNSNNHNIIAFKFFLLIIMLSFIISGALAVQMASNARQLLSGASAVLACTVESAKTLAPA